MTHELLLQPAFFLGVLLGARTLQYLLVAALVFASFVAVFALQNAQTVPMRFFAWERETSVAVIALAAAAVGALSATLAGSFRQVAAGFRLRQVKAELERVRDERDALQERIADRTPSPETSERVEEEQSNPKPVPQAHRPGE